MPALLPADGWPSVGVYLGRRARPDWLECGVLEDIIGDSRSHQEFVLQAVAA